MTEASPSSSPSKADKDGIIQKLRAEVEELTQHIKALDNIVNEKDSEISYLRRELEQATGKYLPRNLSTLPPDLCVLLCHACLAHNWASMAKRCGARGGCGGRLTVVQR